MVIDAFVCSFVEFCVEQAKKIGLIELMAESLSREDNPVIVMSELVVISKYGVSGWILCAT